MGEELPETPSNVALATFLAKRRKLDPAHFVDLSLSVVKLMGPGEYAYHLSPNRCWCSRDHTRMFRMNYMGRLWVAPELLLWSDRKSVV